MKAEAYLSLLVANKGDYDMEKPFLANVTNATGLSEAARVTKAYDSLITDGRVLRNPFYRVPNYLLRPLCYVILMYMEANWFGKLWIKLKYGQYDSVTLLPSEVYKNFNKKFHIYKSLHQRKLF